MPFDRLYKSIFVPFVTFSGVVVVWEVVILIMGWSTQVLPRPYHVFVSFIELVENGRIFKDSVASLYRVTVGFYLAVLLAVPLGILLGRNRVLNQYCNPLIQFLRPISPLAWIPLAMLWFGIGDKPAFFLIFLASFFPLLVATIIAAESINPLYFQVAANFNFSKREIVMRIIIPAIIPELLTALRLTIAIAWLVVVAAEMIAVQSGLGYLILDSRNALRMDYVMVGMIVIGAIGLILDLIMQQICQIELATWWKVTQK